MSSNICTRGYGRNSMIATQGYGDELFVRPLYDDRAPLRTRKIYEELSFDMIAPIIKSAELSIMYDIPLIKSANIDAKFVMGLKKEVKLVLGYKVKVFNKKFIQRLKAL